MNQQKLPNKNTRRDTLNKAARLSGMAIQMGVIIYLAVKGGRWLDTHYGTEKVFLPISTLLGVAVSIYLVVQQLKRINN
jgi:F0F1-type ATP synthase assembly protein I